MDYRELRASDLLNMKHKINTVFAKRNGTGSVANLVGDFTVTAPEAGGAFLDKHATEVIKPMRAVNPAGMPPESGEITRAGLEAMELAIDTWSAYTDNNKTANNLESTGCAAACTGLCYTACTGSCRGSCSGTCTGSCSYCSSDCSSGCSGSCSSSCSYTSCKGSCGTNCSAGCDTSCNSCKSQVEVLSWGSLSNYQP